MARYILIRLALVIPTLLGIMFINFLIVQAAPGGPVEQTLAKLSGLNMDSTARISGSGSEFSGGAQPLTNAPILSYESKESHYRGAQGLPPEIIKEIEAMYGFNKPAHERFWEMLKDYASMDFGESFYRDVPVLDLVMEKMPVSLSLGIWSTLIIYLISIPLGIAKSIRDGGRFDFWSSMVIIIGYAIPSFLFAILMVVLFAGGSVFDLFPLRGLTSDNWDQLPWAARITDYFWHITLPVLAMVVGGFATLTMLTKNSFIEEINKQYVLTARAKGCTEKQVLYRHIFRNALLIVIAGFPAAFLGAFFTGSLLIEVIFSLDGLGLLGFEAVIARDYPVMFGTLYIFSFIGILTTLLTDLTYRLVDPRIDFDAR